MRPSLLYKKSFACLWLASMVHSHAAAPDMDKDNFSSILSKKAFAPLVDKTPVIKKEPVKPPPPKVDYILKGVTKFDGKWSVFVSEKSSPSKSIHLSQKNTSKDQPQIVSVTPDKKDYRNTKVEIKTPDGQMQTIGFNMDNLKKLSGQKTGPAPANKPRTSRTPTPRNTTSPSPSTNNTENNTPKPPARRRIIIPRKPTNSSR